MFTNQGEGANAQGEFSDGVSRVDSSWLNMVQRELLAVLDAAGITPGASVYTQVSQAIGYLISAAIAPVAADVAAVASDLATVTADLAVVEQDLADAFSNSVVSGERTTTVGPLAFKFGSIANVPSDNEAVSVVFQVPFTGNVLYMDLIIRTSGTAEALTGDVGEYLRAYDSTGFTFSLKRDAAGSTVAWVDWMAVGNS